MSIERAAIAMSANPFLSRFEIFQYAWVVPNIEAAARNWNSLLGVGPFVAMHDVSVAGQTYRGRPSATRFSVAIAINSGVQIELIEQLDDSKSAYRDTVPAGSTQFHHVGIWADDFDATLAHFDSKGIYAAASGQLGATRYAYVDAKKSLGHMIEIVERTDDIKGFFKSIDKASENWDHDMNNLVQWSGSEA
jgi:catechol 2,3-dioxygenase-like lactoylglutathione lyase family enzyme